MAETPLELLNEITELNDISEYMQDPQLDRALELLTKILFEKGAIPQEKAPKIITELQALATVFSLKATFYATIGKAGTAESRKKNVYFTAKESINKLVDALKYLSK